MCVRKDVMYLIFFKKKKRKPPLLSNLQGLERIFWNEFLLTCIGLSFSDCSDAAQVLAANAEEAWFFLWLGLQQKQPLLVGASSREHGCPRCCLPGAPVPNVVFQQGHFSTHSSSPGFLRRAPAPQPKSRARKPAAKRGGTGKGVVGRGHSQLGELITARSFLFWS